MIELTCDEVAAVDRGTRDHSVARASALFRNVDLSLVVQIPRV